MAFSFNNLFRAAYLRSGLTSILYFLPALYFQYVSDMKPRKIKILLPPVFVYLFIFCHHIVLSRPVVKFRIAYPVDLLLTGLEIAAFIIMWRLSSSSEPVYLSLAVFHITAFVVLLLISFLKLFDVFRARKFPEFQTKFDYWTGEPWKEEGAKEAQEKFESQGWNMKLVTLFSRFVVALFIYLTIGFTWNLAIIGPLKEAQTIAIREYRSLYYPDNDLKSSNTGIWNVIVGRPTSSHDPELAPAVEVILLSNGSDGIPCPIIPWPSNLPLKKQFSPTPMMLDATAFRCPYKANVLVTVNFTRLGVASNSVADDSRSSVQVMVDSATDNPVGGLRRTEIPILLNPGINLIGFAKLHIMQKFKRPSLSTLGLFWSYDTFLVSNVVNLGSDPQASTSALIARAPDIATLRIIPLVDFSDWRIVQDYRDKSVLGGFSTVGGLWTFLGGIFAFLFGKSISYIAFNMKPLSTFGIVDQLCSNELRQQYYQTYAGLEDDMKRAYNQFMMDHFVDVELIRGKQQPNGTTSDHTAGGASAGLGSP